MATLDIESIIEILENAPAPQAQALADIVRDQLSQAPSTPRVERHRQAHPVQLIRFRRSVWDSNDSTGVAVFHTLWEGRRAGSGGFRLALEVLHRYGTGTITFTVDAQCSNDGENWEGGQASPGAGSPLLIVGPNGFKPNVANGGAVASEDSSPVRLNGTRNWVFADSGEMREFLRVGLWVEPFGIATPYATATEVHAVVEGTLFLLPEGVGSAT